MLSEKLNQNRAADALLRNLREPGGASAFAANIQSSRTIALPDVVRSWELERFVEHVQDHVDILSLDCFDTILWRRTRTPIDVFFNAENSEAFAKWGLNAKLRVRAESAARSLKQVQKERFEVTLGEIYRGAFPQLSDDEVEELSRAELEAEKAACFGYRPTLDMIQAAKKAGLKIIVVSDSYLKESQLRWLLSECIPDEVYKCIDEVFVSSSVGVPKAAGMFGNVLEQLRVKPERIVHVGDNLAADCIAARAKGIGGVHLQQLDEYDEEILRLGSTAGALLDPESRGTNGLVSPYHGVLSAKEHPTDGAYRLGYGGMGPIMYAFAAFVRQELEALRSQGKTVKPLFLLRDAYLPQKVVQAISEDAGGSAVSISRFVSYAASFRSLRDIDEYLARSAGAAKFDAMVKQLLLPPKEAELVLSRTRKAKDPKREFVKQVRKEKHVAKIIAESEKFRQRLYTYLEKTVDLKDGDTLVFVDLGYEGTAQRELGPVFRDERDVEIRGCYLMASRVAGWETNRSGLLDPSWCDDRVVAALVPYVALIEDLCTADAQSVIDYTEDGEVIGAEHVIDEEQFRRIQPVQAACVDFVKEAERFFEVSGGAPEIGALRRAGMAAIARLLFFPSRAEIEYLEGFRLDMNMGTIDSFALFDRHAGLDGLTRRGMFFMEKNQDKLRMNYPIELRTAGLELSMTLLAQHRYGGEFSQRDLNHREIELEVLALRGAQSTTAVVKAQATHDGCFAAIISLGACDFDVGVLLARKFEWLQVHSIDLIPTDKLYQDDESLHTEDGAECVTLENMTDHGAGILECQDPSGFLFLSPRNKTNLGRSVVCRLVFKPLSPRLEPVVPTETG